ncbi:hypothetical protein [Pseudobacteroides cellulosolvens]|uniref:Type IV pilus assembly protein PilO n=1 Tax=Pseudobacteroides cellulosolvens ATCC 35603 = DSM 2933 TaxID=398512 RepID=A0A0L6JLU6_9FIRM|nr:hypothetical protein [Pseudobacteroides cellulosolvens]KNY26705.1 hypothetical protein Bccel_1970 [Pseudobacteroides cellulosolvens ATCC 35603 = DSM 2933]
MNFTAKDKKTLTIVGIFLVLFFSWKFFFSPQLNSISALKKEIKEKKDIYSTNMIYKDKSNNLESELKFLNQRLQDIKVKYPPDLNYDEIFMIIKKLASSSGVSISNIKFDVKSGSSDVKSPQEQVPADPSQVNTGQENKGEANSSSSITAAVGQPIENNTLDSDGRKIQQFINEFGMPVSGGSDSKAPFNNGEGYKIGLMLAGKGKMNQIQGFLKGVEDMKNKTLYNQIQINKGTDENLIFNLSLSFLGIYNNTGGSKIIEDKDLPVAEKEVRQDIFNPYEGYVGQNISTESTINKENTTNITIDEIKKYDFTMRVMPYGDNMAPPTVSLTAKKAVLTGVIKNMPVVYGDSSNEVNVELYVEELKGKYYFKFKTSQEAFPDPQYIGTHEFLSEGNGLTFLVDSTPRKYLGDKSSAVIKIINKTKKNVKVDVINEDKNNPRVKFENLQPNISVSYR